MFKRSAFPFALLVLGLAACSSETAPDAPESDSAAVAASPATPLDVAAADVARLSPVDAAMRAVECRRAIAFASPDIPLSRLPADLAQAVRAVELPGLGDVVRAARDLEQPMEAIAAIDKTAIRPPVGDAEAAPGYNEYLWGCIAVMQRFSTDRAAG